MPVKKRTIDDKYMTAVFKLPYRDGGLNKRKALSYDLFMSGCREALAKVFFCGSTSLSSANRSPFENLRANGESKGSPRTEKLNNFNLSPFTLSLSKGKLRTFARSSRVYPKGWPISYRGRIRRMVVPGRGLDGMNLIQNTVDKSSGVIRSEFFSQFNGFVEGGFERNVRTL